MGAYQDATTVTMVYGSLLVTGLAASLHCIGMCGPILLGFSELFARADLTVHGRVVEHAQNMPRRPLWLDLSCYHAGRVWTYAMLGFLVGLAGERLRETSRDLGSGLSVGIGLGVVVCGVVMLGVLPWRVGGRWLSGCGSPVMERLAWVGRLARQKGCVARLLLGAVMGLLPCGMVYAALVVVAVLPSPAHSAGGMVVFGLGTLPSLTGVFLLHRVVPARYRAYGTRAAGVVVMLVGSLMVGRTVLANGWVCEWAGDTGHHASVCEHSDAGQPEASGEPVPSREVQVRR